MARKFHLPLNHQPGMKVPLPGSSCANCAFGTMAGDGPRCTNKYYQEWAGTSALMDPLTGKRVMDARQYCSDWYEPVKG